MAKGKGAVFVKQAATGRVGILPDILPVPPVEALRKCANDKGSVGTVATAVANAANARFTRRMSECAMGDGGTITLATVANTLTGATTRVLDKGTVVRPSGTGQVVVTVDLWGNGSGHFATAADAHALLGQPSVALTALRPLTRLTGVTYRARLGTGPTGAALVSGTAAGGITMDTSTAATAVPDDNGIVRQSLAEDSGLYCRPGTRGRIEVDNLKPGGWYWIDDDENSAVAAFIPKEAMGNEQIEPTDTGGVVLDSERGGPASALASASTRTSHKAPGPVFV